MIRFLSNSKVLQFYFICSISLIFLPGIFSSGAVVTLQSIQIFKTHEWLNNKPTVYFRCQDENKTVLPDVNTAHSLYTFNGEESWQPLTVLEKKCKRCGLYEEDTIETDDIFDAWEFCPSDFTSPEGNYTRFKDKEFNATFYCPDCVGLGTRVFKGNGMNVILVVVITVLVTGVSIFGAVTGYRYWQKKKREQDQARFLKLFEDDDELEEELGLGPIV
ncbi:hypothetical protein C5167_000750 [Papaver somniferum]|uniref:DUF7953 domain-containing protein n=1 Tax=Papaver somniferum TaxID=3469 RepID=A0A4Y7KWS9_PAPSO|nr:uncharacterized protein LOC113309081 [Papaver somniferum]RZC76628.1 hypothetical protein C5167_000750 [Papaver somniferum]